MSSLEEQARAGEQRRLLHLVAAAAVGVAVIGFLSGTRDSGEDVRGETGGATGATDDVADGPADDAIDDAAVPRYEALRAGRRGPNAGMYDGALAALREGLPGVEKPVVRDDAARAAALDARAARRAYEGAPPTIPHDIEQLDPPACLACHQQGVVVAGRIAPAISHPPYQSCTQCHVVARDPRRMGEAPPPPANDFVGLGSSGPGARAWPGAPPTIPHSTWMRSRCASCHGVTGRPGIRTTHPQRQSCLQCHAASARLDQRAPVSGEPDVKKGAHP